MTNVISSKIDQGKLNFMFYCTTISLCSLYNHQSNKEQTNCSRTLITRTVKAEKWNCTFYFLHISDIRKSKVCLKHNSEYPQTNVSLEFYLFIYFTKSQILRQAYIHKLFLILSDALFWIHRVTNSDATSN
jgi:hypothetical protein